MQDQKLSPTHSVLPKVIRNKVKLATKYLHAGDMVKLRMLRDNSSNLIIRLYHHSQGTDSYYCDLNRAYFTFKQLGEIAKDSLERGETSCVLIKEYISGVHFVSGQQIQKQIKYN